MKQISEHAQVGKLCKAYLKAQNIPCKVRSDSYAGGNSVHVKITDLPPLKHKEVEQHLKQYQGGTFNGMEDIYEHDYSKTGPTVKYLFVRNKISKELKEEIKTYLKNEFDVYDDTSANRAFGTYYDNVIWRAFNSEYDDLNFWAYHNFPKV